MAASDDPAEAAEAAERLEAALERIATFAGRTHALPSGADAAEIADRLDALIAKLRAALNDTAG